MRVYNSVGKISPREAARDAQASAAAFAVMPKRIAAAVEAEFDALTSRGDLVEANFAITKAGAEWARQVSERQLLDFIDDAEKICGKQGVAHAELVALARAGARAVSGVVTGLQQDQAAQAAEMVAAEIGAQFPQSASDNGKAQRAQCSVYWRRQLSARHVRALEQAAREAGRICRSRELYCTDELVKLRQEQKRRNGALLASMIAINEMGQEYTLAELADKGQANPKNRKADLMTRIGGTEQIAVDLGHAGEFWTMTAPSRFHAYSKNGRRNKKFDGSTPKDAQSHMCRVWEKFRAALHRTGIRIYGFRVVEPHHDGTPHWHMLFFMAAEHVEEVRQLMASYAYADDAAELKNAKAKKARFFAKAIDFNLGSAAGYIAKYICKNVDGKTTGDHQDPLLMGDNEAGRAANLADTAVRVDAWASANGFRQFQPVGLPPVQVWREIRRVADGVDECLPIVQQAAAAADAGNWAEFMRIMGGHSVGRKLRPIRTYTVQNIEPGRYGETCDQIKGIEAVESIEARQAELHAQAKQRKAERAALRSGGKVAEWKDKAAERKGYKQKMALRRVAEWQRREGFAVDAAAFFDGVAIRAGQVERVKTRLHEWVIADEKTIEAKLAQFQQVQADKVFFSERALEIKARSGSGFGVGVGVGFERSGEAASTRTGVNNCTPPDSWAALFEDVESFLVGVGDDKNGKIDRIGGTGEQQEYAIGGGPHQTGRWPEC